MQVRRAVDQSQQMGEGIVNATQALTRLRKLLGPKAGYQDGKRPSSQEQRDAAHKARVAVNERARIAREAMEERRADILSADVEYQRLKNEFATVRAEQERTPHGGYYRYSAGRVNGVGGISFFHQEAEADTLVELVEKVEAKRVAA